MSVKNDKNSGQQIIILILLMYLNQYSDVMAEWSKIVLHSSIDATSILEYFSGWCGHWFITYSQLFLLTYHLADKSLWHSAFNLLLIWRF